MLQAFDLLQSSESHVLQTGLDSVDKVLLGGLKSGTITEVIFRLFITSAISHLQSLSSLWSRCYLAFTEFV